MKSPKILLFLTIISLVVASGWLSAFNVSAAPVTDAWPNDSNVQHSTSSQSVKAERLDVSKLPPSRALSANEINKLLNLVPPLDLSVDLATFTKLKADATTNLPPVGRNIQKFSGNKNGRNSAPLGGVITSTSAPSVINNFGGPSMGGYYPADASIAVGPTSIIACVNASVVGYDKTGNQLYNIPMTTWWSSAQRSGYSLIFNPVCKYDSLGGRFIIVAALQNSSPFVSKYLVSVSLTSDNNSGWYTYAFDASVDGSTASALFAAFPDIGVDNNAVYITSNQYTVSAQTFTYSKIRVFKKSDLYNNTVSGWTDFWNFNNRGGVKAFAVRASLSMDPTDYEYLADSLPNGGSTLQLFRITTSNPWTTPVFSRAATGSTVGAYSIPPNAIDYDNSVYARVPTGDNRLLNMVLRNGSLWTAHTISASTTNTSVAAIRWYQFDPVGAGEQQEGTFIDGRDGISYYYPAITVDALGAMGLTFTLSGPHWVESSINYGYPSPAFTGRLSTDTVGMVEKPQYSFAPGARPNTSGRWGAYNGAAIDPTSNRMWFIGQLPGASNKSWTTQIYSTELSFAAPFNKTSPADGASNSPVNTTLSWSASTGANSYQYCFDITNDNACNWATAATTTSLSASISLQPTTTYYWQVRAVKGASYTYADGSSTSFRQFATGALPPAFGKISPTTASTDQTIPPSLNWNPSAGVTSYGVCITTISTGCVSGTPYWTNVGNVTTWSPSGLSSSTIYYWQVRANNSIGKTYADSGTAWTFTTGVLPESFNKSTPSNAATAQPHSLTLEWTPSTGATSYSYCFDTSPTACTSSGSGTWYSTATTNAGISGLNSTTTYYWNVKAVNGTGTTWSDSNSVWSFTTG